MADFRGVDREALIDSFVRAGLFLRSQNLGAATAGALDALDRNDVITKIRTAGDQKQLAEAMRKTEVLPLLSLYQDLFVYHAATEKAEGGNDQVQNLYRDLMAWSAFFDESANAKPPIQKEVRAHIVLDVLNRLAVAGPEIETACGAKLDTAVTETGNKDKKLADWLETAVPVVQLLHSTAEQSELVAWLAGASSAQDGCLQRVLCNMCDLSEDNIAAVPKAMELYKILLSNQAGSPQEMKPDQWQEHVKSVKTKVQLAMVPFANTAQAAKIELRPLSREKDKFSLSFYGTRNAAQAAADSLRAYSLNVVDPQGHIVEPPQRKLLGGPPASPAPGVS